MSTEPCQCKPGCDFDVYGRPLAVPRIQLWEWPFAILTFGVVMAVHLYGRLDRRLKKDGV